MQELTPQANNDVEDAEEEKSAQKDNHRIIAKCVIITKDIEAEKALSDLEEFFKANNDRHQRTGSEGVSSTRDFHVQARMSKMTSGTPFFRIDRINTLFKKYIKSSLRVFLVVIPVRFNEPLKLSKELFNYVQVRRIRWLID